MRRLQRSILFFTEVVDTTLRYNFNCPGYDCAAENAYLEQAGQVLAWGINDYSELNSITLL